MKRLLSSRAGIRTWMHTHADKTFTIETEQDAGPILERNKAMALERGKRINDRINVPVASIPITVQYEWMKRYGISNVFDEEYEPLIRRLLNSNEWRYLRTSEIYL
jgi:hypothetical protein